MPLPSKKVIIKKVPYLSNTTQLACAVFASVATAPQGDPETILILKLICLTKSGYEIIQKSNVSNTADEFKSSNPPYLDHKHRGAEVSSASRNQ